MTIAATFFIQLLFISGYVSGQTQTDLTQTAVNAYKKADKKLNSTYKQILKEYVADTVFTKNLKTSQSLWIRFRDAEVKMKYPDDDYAGTSTPMCKAQLLEKITAARTKTLNVWLTGIPEGDVCAGTVRAKN